MTTEQAIINVFIAQDEDTRNRIIFQMLDTGVISFTEITKIYVSALQKKKEENSDIITELGFSLAMYKNRNFNQGTDEDLLLKANKALVKSQLFKGTEFEAELLSTSDRPKYEYEMFFQSQDDEPVKIDGWIAIATDRIRNPERIDKYIKNGLLRRIK
jgi:hypothetical protein